MRRISVLSVALLAIGVAVSASASSAAAAKCEKHVGSKHFVVCIGGEKLSGESVEVSSALKPEKKLRLGYYGEQVLVGCTGEGLVKGKLVNGGAASATLNGQFALSGCTIEEAPGRIKETCSTPANPLWKETVGSFGGEGSMTLRAAAGEWFTEEFVTGSECTKTLAGSFLVGGAPECKVTSLEVESISKELLCTGTKSKIYMSGWGPGKFVLEGTLQLTGAKKGQAFSVVEG